MVEQSVAGKSEQIVRLFAEQAIGRGNIGVLADVLHPEFVAYIPICAAPVRGREAYARLLAGFAAACPGGMKFTLHDLFAIGERAAFRFTAVGTHTGPLFGAAPSGQRLEMGEAHLLQLRDGKIYEDHVADTTPDLLRLLGVRADILAG